MNWDAYFTPEMRAMWTLMDVEAAKEYALRESVRDVSHLFELRSWFVLHGGGENTATQFTVRAVAELIHQNLIAMAVFDKDGNVVRTNASIGDIVALVEGLPDSGPRDLLSATEKGRKWVMRYDELSRELSIPWDALD